MGRWRILNWVALFALLCQVLAPSAALASAGSRDDGAIPICTASGIVWVSLDEDGRPSAPDLPAEKPCHFCLSQTASFAPLQTASIIENRVPCDSIVYLVEGDTDLSKAAAKAQGIRGPPLNSPIT